MKLYQFMVYLFAQFPLDFGDERGDAALVE